MFTVKKFLLSRYTPLKQDLLIFLREYISAAENFAGVFFCGRFFCGSFFLADRRKSAKSAIILNSYTVIQKLYAAQRDQNQMINIFTTLFHIPPCTNIITSPTLSCYHWVYYLVRIKREFSLSMPCLFISDILLRLSTCPSRGAMPTCLYVISQISTSSSSLAIHGYENAHWTV